jgi:hypothetical protein
MRSAGRSFGDVIEVTDFITKTMGTPGNFAQSIRDVMIPVVSKLAPFQTGFAQTLSELAVAYHGSPVVEWAGERCFDESFRGGRGIGGRFVLFVGADADSVTTAQAQHVAEDFQAVLELRTGRQRSFVPTAIRHTNRKPAQRRAHCKQFASFCKGKRSVRAASITTMNRCICHWRDASGRRNMWTEEA